MTADLFPQASTPEHVASLAKLYGEPMLHMPNDLYIPPDALTLFLETFEGPLDLLLYLIRKQNFDILDIPMAEVTKQYLTYVDQLREHNLELAAEYLLMAAMLIEIKSRLLLPTKPSDTEDSTEDPRAALVRRLLEYEKIKLAAQQLDDLPQIDRDFLLPNILINQNAIARFADVNVIDLQLAFADLFKRAKLTQNHKIGRKELSVREHMSSILRALQNKKFVEFSDLFDASYDIPTLIVNFIALLELAKETLIDITQAEAFAPIYVRLSYTPAS